MAKINSFLSNQTLNRLDKNDKERKSKLNKLATGQKLNSAGDGAADFSISEKMRIRIRALGQAKGNTMIGGNLLKIAEGAIQSQLDIMRTIKQKVIDACNDTNTDLDRETIQKEINHGYQQIEDIAYETNYNGIPLLYGGDYVKESVYAWEVKPEGELVEGSDRLNVIPDNYDTLDELTGPFDIFSRWKQTNDWTTSAPIELSTRNSTTGDPDTNLMQTSTQPYQYYLTSYLETDNSGAVTGISFSDNMYTDSNISNLMIKSEATLGYYELDFSGVDCSDPANLHETGFRFYCATDKLQWYNIMLYNGVKELPEKRPKSGTATEDITTIRVDIAGDVSHVTNPSELVDVIYNKADADLKELKHYYRLARMPDSTHLVLYDPRRTDVLTNTRVLLQVGTKANQSIKVDNFDMRAKALGLISNDGKTIQLTTQKQAEALLTKKHDNPGEKETPGLLDRAINYALDVQTTIGALQSRLEYTVRNLTTASENVQSAESVIRDADMAKEMTNYTKHNVLLQAAQSMLAQANQNSSAVLSLLQ